MNQDMIAYWQEIRDNAGALFDRLAVQHQAAERRAERARTPNTKTRARADRDELFAQMEDQLSVIRAASRRIAQLLERAL